MKKYRNNASLFWGVVTAVREEESTLVALSTWTEVPHWLEAGATHTVAWLWALAGLGCTGAPGRREMFALRAEEEGWAGESQVTYLLLLA